MYGITRPSNWLLNQSSNGIYTSWHSYTSVQSNVTNWDLSTDGFDYKKSVKLKLDQVEKCSIRKNGWLSCTELFCQSQRLPRWFSSSLQSEATLLLEILATIVKFVPMKNDFVVNDFERCRLRLSKSICNQCLKPTNTFDSLSNLVIRRIGVVLIEF